MHDPQLEALEYQAIQDPHEIAYREYQFETWSEQPETWSPCITLEQLEKRPDLEIEWYARDWVPVGAKTILSAEPKTGKTIFLFHLLRSITNGQDFLGKPCPPTKALYLTEQTEQEYKRQICEVPNLIGNKNFFVLLAEETPAEHKTWEDTIAFAEKMLAITKSKILVIDTFGSLAKLPPHGENDAATIQNQINKLNTLFKNRYLSIILTHHNRKKSEDYRNQGTNLAIASARGSSAFVGGAGHLVYMDAPDKSTKRTFSFYGRYNHGMTKTLYLNNNEYKESINGY